MTLSRVRDLYVADLSEIFESEEEILRQLPLMAARASDPALRGIFEDHYRDTQRHVARLTTILGQLDERRRHTLAPAIRGLVEESRLRQAFLEPGDVLDLALAGFGRRLEHYEIASYGTILTYARRLGHDEPARLLTETLDEERRADARLEMLSAPARVNAA